MSREEVLALIAQEQALHETLLATNQATQTKLCEMLKKKRVQGDDKLVEVEGSKADHERRYAGILASMKAVKKTFEDVQAENQKEIEAAKVLYQEKKREFEEREKELQSFMHECAVNAENSRTGNNISAKVVAQIEAADAKKNQEVFTVRLENIKLRNKVKRFEQELKQKEQLADGLHLIDFEQLKIENQAYNEKIEERNEELMKLRKKITSVVQILAHSKEKMTHQQHEHKNLTTQLQEIEEKLSQQRDKLPLIKQKKESLRHANTFLRQKNGLLLHDNLLRDYESRVDDVENLISKIKVLSSTYAETLSKESKLQKRKRNKRVLPYLIN